MPLTRLYEKHFLIGWDKSLTTASAITVMWSVGYTVFIKSHVARVIHWSSQWPWIRCGWGEQHVDEDQKMVTNLKMCRYDLMRLSKCKLKSPKIKYYPGKDTMFSWTCFKLMGDSPAGLCAHIDITSLVRRNEILYYSTWSWNLKI